MTDVSTCTISINGGAYQSCSSVDLSTLLGVAAQNPANTGTMMSMFLIGTYLFGVFLLVVVLTFALCSQTESVRPFCCGAEPPRNTIPRNVVISKSNVVAEDIIRTCAIA